MNDAVAVTSFRLAVVMDVTRLRRRGQQAVLVANFKIERIQVGEIKPVNVVTECPTLGLVAQTRSPVQPIGTS